VAKTLISLRINGDLLERVKAAAKKRNVTMTAIVESAFDSYATEVESEVMPLAPAPRDGNPICDPTGGHAEPVAAETSVEQEVAMRTHHKAGCNCDFCDSSARFLRSIQAEK
jgi:hypothetical protein